MIRRILVVLAAALLVFTGCRRNALPSVEGRVVDATIHSITLLTAAGDSVTVSTLGTDPMHVPGVLSGDEVRIGYELLPDGETMRALVLDITTPSAYRLLPGIWRDCTGADEVGLVLAEDGSARAVGLGELPLQDWSLDEENLVLTAVEQEDPKATRTLLFAIQKLDVDSLVVLPAGGGPALAFSRAE
ncbi:MAG: hypothetical protein IKP15_00050 [Bacteroidales bacterium]|nr:hypothetical protein [Bacteroidales bacterium]